MYIIITYDVAKERVNKILNISRQYLTWVQRSVLEGEITNPNLQKLKNQISAADDKNHDTVTIYRLKTHKHLRKTTLGKTENQPTQII